MLKKPKLLILVLIISIAIVLSSCTARYASEYVTSEEEATEGLCPSQVPLKIVELNGVKQVFYRDGNDGYLILTVSNIGDKDIDSLGIMAYGEKSILAISVIEGSSSKVAEAVQVKVDYNDNIYGDIKKIEVIPTFKFGNAFKKCISHPLTISSEEVQRIP